MSDRMTHHREPTEAELFAITRLTVPDLHPTQADFEHHRPMVEDAYIVVYPNYMTDSPGYCGRVAVIVWPGAPSIVTTVTFDSDPPAAYNGELDMVERPEPHHTNAFLRSLAQGIFTSSADDDSVLKERIAYCDNTREMSVDEAQANAARFAACWNACNTIPTSGLSLNVLLRRTINTDVFKATSKALTEAQVFIIEAVQRGALNDFETKPMLERIDRILKTGEFA